MKVRTEYHELTGMRTEYFLNDDLKKGEDGPSKISYYKNGDVSTIDYGQIFHEGYWWTNVFKREDGLKTRHYYENGNIEYEFYDANITTKEDRPSFLDYFKSGQKRHFIWHNASNALHRENGPVSVPASVVYYESGQVKSEWYGLNGKLHRNDEGPNIIEYYESGQIREEYFAMNNQGNAKVNKYNEDGSALVVKSSNNNKKVYKK